MHYFIIRSNSTISIHLHSGLPSAHGPLHLHTARAFYLLFSSGTFIYFFAQFCLPLHFNLTDILYFFLNQLFLFKFIVNKYCTYISLHQINSKVNSLYMKTYLAIKSF